MGLSLPCAARMILAGCRSAPCLPACRRWQPQLGYYRMSVFYVSAAVGW